MAAGRSFPLLFCRSVRDGAKGWVNPLNLHYDDQHDHVEICLVVASGRAEGNDAARIQLPFEQVRVLRDRLTQTLTSACPACRAAASLNLAPEQVVGAHTCGR